MSEHLSDKSGDEIRNKPKYDPRIISKDKREQMASLIEQQRSWGKNIDRYHKGELSSENDAEAEEEEAMEAEILRNDQQNKYQEDDFIDLFVENRADIDDD